MKVCIVGLGSMGKRRIRNLLTLGFKPEQIHGYDVRDDRTMEAKNKYGIHLLSSLDSESITLFDALIVSTPPDHHLEYIQLAVRNSIPVFVEASVILQGLEELLEESRKRNALVAPSCTMRFHPAIKLIKRLVKNGKYGNVTTFTYYIGQYLPDWHPWEDIRDFYVSKKNTSGAREMVTFEFTWLTDILGFPREVKAYRGKTFDFGKDLDFDDTYVIALHHGDYMGSVVIDVVSRFPTRLLICNLEHAQIRWDWNENKVRVYDAIDKRWIEYHDPKGTSIPGYHEGIVEEMYVDELKTFLEAIKGETTFPNTLEDDIKILKLLERIES